MNIEKLEIKDFGKFTGNIVIDDIGDIALFYGENESGKTTLFNLIKSLVYGFYPANCEANPYSSWENGRIEFTAYLKRDSGEEVIVERKLLSTPRGTLKMKDKQVDLKNRTLPWAEHVSQEIFEKVYHLRVEDLIDLEGKAWEEVEDKLLANYGTEAIRSPREVLKEIKKDCDELWRESNRGNFKIKKLQEEIRELKKSRKDLYKNEEDIRKLDKEIDDLHNKISALEDEAFQLKGFLKKGKELKPVKDILDEIEESKSKLIKEDITNFLPQNIREKLREMEEELHSLNKEINKKIETMEDIEEKIYRLNDLEKLILENKSNIEHYIKERDKIQLLEEKVKDLEDEIKKIRDRLIYEGDNILIEPWNDDIKSAISKIKKSELRIFVNKYKEAKDKLNELLLRQSLSREKESEVKFSKGYYLSFIFAFIALISGYFLDFIPLKTLGWAVLFYGITGVINYYHMKRNMLKPKEGEGSFNGEIERFREEARSAKDSLAKYLEGIPISPILIDNLDDMFLPNLITLIDLGYQLEEKEEEMYRILEEYKARVNKLLDFLKQFIKEMDYNIDGIYSLRDTLDNLKDILENNKELEKEISSIKRDIENLTARYNDISEKRIEYLDALKKVDEDIERAINILEENYSLNNRINLLMEKLGKWENLNSLIEEIERLKGDDNWAFSEYEINRAEEELERINKEIIDLKEERIRKEEQLKQLLNNPTIDEIESRIHYLEDELSRAALKRDKLILLSEVIRYSDEKFKEANQPDVIKNASNYFKIMTGGKYTDIYIDYDGEKRKIMIKGREEDFAREVLTTFSKGTLNQLYLSLRLSLIDHLDKNKETLPISFDELLVNWDDNRLANSLTLLKEICKHRQLFIFTCHDWIARKIEDYFLIKRKTLY